MAERYGDRLAIVGIAVQETTPDDVSAYAERYELPYTIAFDASADVFDLYRVFALPDAGVHRAGRPDHERGERAADASRPRSGCLGLPAGGSGRGLGASRGLGLAAPAGKDLPTRVLSACRRRKETASNRAGGAATPSSACTGRNNAARVRHNVARDAGRVGHARRPGGSRAANHGAAPGCKLSAGRRAALTTPRAPRPPHAAP